MINNNNMDKISKVYRKPEPALSPHVDGKQKTSTSLPTAIETTGMVSLLNSYLIFKSMDMKIFLLKHIHINQLNLT